MCENCMLLIVPIIHVIFQTDKDMINRSFSKTGIDSDLLPFGRVTKDALQKAKAILNKML